MEIQSRVYQEEMVYRTHKGGGGEKRAAVSCVNLRLQGVAYGQVWRRVLCLPLLLFGVPGACRKRNAGRTARADDCLAIIYERGSEILRPVTSDENSRLNERELYHLLV
jgi:hypothetical protein